MDLGRRRGLLFAALQMARRTMPDSQTSQTFDSTSHTPGRTNQDSSRVGFATLARGSLRGTVLSPLNFSHSARLH